METKILFNERRSVNYFDKNRSLDEALLKEIVDLAVLAPSAFNLQPWRIIAVKSETAKIVDNKYFVLLSQILLRK